MSIVLKELQGLADSKWGGVEGAVAECVGLDLHSTPGIAKVRQKLTKESGATVDAFAKVAIAVSSGETFWFSSTTGKIWRRSSTGTWLLVYTTSPAAGAAGCLGAIEYNGFIYWATQSRLHRISMATAHATASDWTTNVALNWQTFTKTDASWHPMVIQDQTLFIGDGHQVAKVDDAAAFTAAIIDLNTPYRIKAMAVYELDIVIGTYIADSVNEATIFRWDCVSPAPINKDVIQEAGINAFIQDDNYLYANAGLAGRIYFYNGVQLMPYKPVPGSYSDTAYGYIHPNSVGRYMGVPVFGFSNGTGNPAKQGVYSFGSYSQDYAKRLDLSFPISEGVLTGIEIGAILVVGFDLLVAWKNDTAYGVDKIDYTAKYASAYFETMMLFRDSREDHKTIAGINVLYDSLPTSTNFVISRNVNGAGYTSQADETVTDETFSAVRSRLSTPDVGSMQVKVAFTVSSNDGPTFEALDVIQEG